MAPSVPFFREGQCGDSSSGNVVDVHGLRLDGVWASLTTSRTRQADREGCFDTTNQVR